MKKVILITGASRGIGYVLAKKMLKENFFVIGACRDGKIEGIEDDDFYSLSLDLSKPLSIENARKTVLAKFKHIDILVNNAGIGPDLDANYPEIKSFEQTFDVNVTGTVFFTESMIDIIENNGKIVNISSKMGSLDVCNRTDSVAYRMSKSALNMYTKILTNRLENNIRVASLHPGWVKTTIAKDNIINGRLTTDESADRIFDFINKDFENGAFWDIEDQVNLPW
ncbi:MAG: SDR family NAD(P)-dependent oxidoreductase [Algibacter sp.]